MPGILKTAVIIPGLLSLVFGLLLFSGAGILAEYWFRNPDLTPVFRLFGLAVPGITLLKLGTELSKGFCTAKFAVLVENLTVPALQIFFFLVLYWQIRGFGALIGAVIAATALGACLISYFILRQMKGVWPDRRVPLKELTRKVRTSRIRKEVVTYSLPLFLSGITAVVMGSIDIIMLGRYASEETVGVYAAAAMVTGLMASTLMMPILSIFSPLIARHQAQDEMGVVADLYAAAVRWLCYLSIPAFAFVILFRTWVMLVFGQDFLEEGPMILLVLSPGYFTVCFTGCVGQLLAMTGHQKKELAVSVAVVIANIGLNFALIPVYGGYGAAAATSVSLVLINLLRVAIVYRIFKIQPFTLKLVRLKVTAVVILGGMVLVQGSISQWQGGLAAALVWIFLTGLIFLGHIDAEDKKIARGIWQKFRGMGRCRPKGIDEMRRE